MFIVDETLVKENNFAKVRFINNVGIGDAKIIWSYLIKIIKSSAMSIYNMKSLLCISIYTQLIKNWKRFRKI